jgi:putative hydrolase of the HAD superfamily
MKVVDTVNAVIFDLFHTLTDKESRWSRIPPTSKMLGVPEIAWNDQLLLHSAKRLTGEWRDPFQILKTMASSIDPTISDETINEVARRRVLRMKAALRKIPTEVIETLQSLRKSGKKIGLVSNLDVMELSGWKTSPLRKLIDCPIFSCEVGLAKPNPEIFKLCLNLIGENAADCLYVGDGGSNELVVSRNLGMRSVFISGMMREFREERIEEFTRQANYKIERLDDLLLLEG